MSTSLELIKRRFDAAYTDFAQTRLNFQRWRDWRKCRLPREFRILFSGVNRRRSALVPPFMKMVVAEFKAKIFNQMFGAMPHFSLQMPGTSGSLDTILERNRNLLMFQQGQEEEQYEEKVSLQILDWLTYGIGIKQPVWRRYQDQDTNSRYEGPGWETVPMFKFFPSTVLDSRGGLSYYFIQHVVFYGRLLELADDGILEKDKVEAIELQSYGDAQQYVEGYETGIKWGDLDATKEADQKIYPVVIWSYADGDELVTVANHKFELKRKANPHGKKLHLGLSVLNLGREPGEFIGESVISIIEDNFIEKFGIRNQRSDARQISVSPQYLSSDPNCPAMFESAPGRIHRISAGMIKEYKPLEWKDETDKAFVEEKYVTGEMKEALGLSNIFMGISPERREAATTQMILQQNAASDLQHTTRLAEKRLVCGDIRGQMSLNNYLLPDSLPPAYQGVDFHRSELIMHAKILALGLSQSISRTVMVANVTGLMNQWGQIDELRREVNWKALARRQIDAMQLPNPDEILPDGRAKDIPIDKENWLLAQGVAVPVDEEEDHMYHRVRHLKAMQEGRIPEEHMDLAVTHLEEHEFRLQQMLGQTQEGGGSPGPSKRSPMHEQDALQSLVSKFRPGSRRPEMVP